MKKIVFIDDFRALITHGHMYGVSMGYQRIWEEGLERGVDAVMFGHTHRPMLEEDEDLILLNPGSLSYPRQKGRQRSYIVMEKEKGKKPSAKKLLKQSTLNRYLKRIQISARLSKPPQDLTPRKMSFRTVLKRL